MSNKDEVTILAARYYELGGFPDAESAWGFHKAMLAAAIEREEIWTKEDPWAEVES